MITRIRGKGQVELRAFHLTDMIPYGYDGLRGFQPTVSESQARGVPALYRAARLRAEALASLRLRCWSGDGVDKVRRDNVWQALLFLAPANPYQDRFAFWETIGESLAWRNNAYIWKNVDPATDRIIEWWALHPDQVVCRGKGIYTVTVQDGYMDPVGRGPAKYNTDYDTIIHLRGHGDGGMYEAPTPIKLFKDAISGPVNRQRYEAKLWTRGPSLQLGIEFPGNIKKTEAEEWKDLWQSSYEGLQGGSTAVIGGGAKIVPIGMTAHDAEFVNLAHLTVHDASRIMGVPANLLGVQLERAVPNLEQDLTSWLRFGLGPELERIESAFSADEQLFGHAYTYPKFDTELFVRGDVQTEATVLVSLVQAGILTPNEARRVRGLDDLPGTIGDIPQITPVGGAPNPAAAAATSNGNGNGGYEE
jgi:HK97 family phage portal protein